VKKWYTVQRREVSLASANCRGFFVFREEKKDKALPQRAQRKRAEERRGGLAEVGDGGGVSMRDWNLPDTE
jgi:hypothetical protein